MVVGLLGAGSHYRLQWPAGGAAVFLRVLEKAPFFSKSCCELWEAFQVLGACKLLDC